MALKHKYTSKVFATTSTRIQGVSPCFDRDCTGRLRGLNTLHGAGVGDFALCGGGVATDFGPVGAVSPVARRTACLVRPVEGLVARRINVTRCGRSTARVRHVRRKLVNMYATAQTVPSGMSKHKLYRHEQKQHMQA